MKINILKINLWAASLLAVAGLSGCPGAASEMAQTGIQPGIGKYAENPYYWEYNGKPVLLLGGSREDNLFNHPEGLEQHLDVLAACGGNYIRNTMSSRNPGNPWAFKKDLETGLYDLRQWNDQYWTRFEDLLRLSLERDIIVQIEVWDPWDFFRSEAAVGFGDGNVGWESCPFNPLLNINYTSEETGLEEVVDYTVHTPNRHLFFQTPPELADIPGVRKYQEALVEKMLSISLNYPNVLYNIRNECREAAEWARYWARFIREHARKAGMEVFITDMRRSEDFSTPEQTDLLNDRVHFDFVDISQNSHHRGQDHYDQVIEIRRHVEGHPIPLNNVKVYGGTSDWTGGIEEGTRRFWRNIFAGAASARFHREGPSENFFGIGLNELAQTHIRSARMLSEMVSIFDARPDNTILGDRSADQAYCLASGGKEYALYFPAGGEVTVDLGSMQGGIEIIWLDILNSRWLDAEPSKGGEQIRLSAPGSGQWAAVIRPAGVPGAR